MFINAHNDWKLATKYVLLNLDTAKLIDNCEWADDESGKYSVYEQGTSIIKSGNIKLLLKSEVDNFLNNRLNYMRNVELEKEK